MLSIQDVGIELLGDNPRSFYAFGGSEYGIKQKYISILADKFGSKVESPTVKSVIDMLSTKRIIPLAPAVYVIRYDETFISELSETLAKKIHGLKFEGCIICIYEADKHISKLDKFLPNNTVTIDSVSPQFIAKYLRTDFPDIDERFIHAAVCNSDNYNQAHNMCLALDSVPASELSHMSADDIGKLFGHSDTSTEIQIRQYVASRSFGGLIKVVEMYDDSLDKVMYTILQTMIELDKITDNKYTQSDIRDFAKYWTREDIYFMFMHTYNELNKLRSGSSYDPHNSLIYLFGLLKFERIPSLEVML